METEVKMPQGASGSSSGLAQLLESLPVIRRWLDSSAPQLDRIDAAEDRPSLSQVRIMVHLYQHGSQTMSQLAGALGISNSTATESVTDLADQGRVVRARSESDRRQVVVQLTPEAEAIASEVQSRRHLVLEKVLYSLSPSESAAFVKGLKLLAEEAQMWLEPSTSAQTGDDPEQSQPVRP